MGTQSSFALVRYNLEFSIRYPKNCRQKSNKDYQHYIIVLSKPILKFLLESWLPLIISNAPVVGNIGRIMNRHCVMSTLCVDKWDSVFFLDDYCRE